MQYNFNKMSIADWHDANSPYDINSILQYNSRIFSINGNPTMTNIVEPYEALGQVRYFLYIIFLLDSILTTIQKGKKIVPIK